VGRGTIRSPSLKEIAMWEYRGVKGRTKTPPDIVGNYEGNILLLIAGSSCVFDDLATFLDCKPDKHLYGNLRKWSMTEGQHVMTINDITSYVECHVHHAASLHADNMKHWIGLRKNHPMQEGRPMIHGNQQSGVLDVEWALENSGALSGFFGATIGVAMGYEQVIMAGNPIDCSARFFDPPLRECAYGKEAPLLAWRMNAQRNPEMMSRIRSLSGNTKTLLGEPELNGYAHQTANA
jgi:hypothetical protein